MYFNDVTLSYDLVVRYSAVAVSVFAVFMGAKLAMGNIKNKQRIDDERARFKQVELAVISAVKCHIALSSAWKQMGKLKDCTDSWRGFNVTVGGHAEIIDSEIVSALSWISEKADVGAIDHMGYRNWAMVQHLFEKYNQWSRTYECLEDAKRGINVELSQVMDSVGIDLKRAIRQTENPLMYLEYIRKFECHVFMTHQLIGMFENFIHDFPAIAEDLIDLKLIEKEKFPTFRLADDSIQANMFDMHVLSDAEREVVMKDLSKLFGEIRKKVTTISAMDGF